jgi:hypothetical protein
MNPTQIFRAVIMLALLGLVILVATRVVGGVASRAAMSL